jgi:N-acylneuraminate cytidylyltransferase
VIDGLTVLGLITARGGSRGVPRKNVRMVAGRPLIGWTIEAAQQSRVLDRLVLSSDDEEIIDIARHLGCEAPFRRPAELAGDTTPSIDVVLHALAQLPGHDVVVLLQPTSPLRTAADIDACVQRLVASGAPSCVSVREAVDHPYWTYRVDTGGRLQPYARPVEGTPARRQDLPGAFAINGAIYATRVDRLLELRSLLNDATVAYAMPADRSTDIDTEDDLEIAERRLRSIHGVADPNAAPPRA